VNLVIGLGDGTVTLSDVDGMLDMLMHVEDPDAQQLLAAITEWWQDGTHEPMELPSGRSRPFQVGPAIYKLVNHPNLPTAGTPARRPGRSPPPPWYASYST